MTHPDLKPVSLIIYSIMALCFGGYALAETAMIKNFAVFFLLVSVVCLSACFFVCQRTNKKYSSSLPETAPSTQLNENHSETDGSAALTNQVLDSYNLLEKGIVNDLTIVRKDLDQIKGLVKDAVSGLTEGFYGVSSNIEMQQQLVNLLLNPEIVQQDDAHHKTLQQLRALNQTIKHDSSLCVRSLQFEDILSQVASHSDHYITDIEKYLRNFKSMVENMPDDANDQNKMINLFKAELSSSHIKRQDQDTKNRTKIIQKNLSEGSVELF